jgi:predicted O-methyltransferase YrrM
LATTLMAGPCTAYSGVAVVSLRDRLRPVATSIVIRLRALKQVIALDCSRGAGSTLRTFDLLVSVHGAGLPQLSLRELEERLALNGAAWPAYVAVHPKLTGCGSGTTADMTALASLVAMRRPHQVLEFGTCQGASTWHLWANAAPDARITTLDLPPGTQVHGSTDVDLQGLTSRPWMPRDPRVRLIEQDSRTWVPDVNDVDFCFIDAGHSYECVKNDTEKAFTVMHAGGIIVWHDASWAREGYAVNRYLRELRASGRDIALLQTGPFDLCMLACLIVQ